MSAALLQNFARLKEAVLQKKPILREILEKRGSKKLADYASDYLEVKENSSSTHAQRKKELLALIYEETRQRLDQKVAKSVVNQLQKYYYVSTTDHHGPLCHPFFLNPDLNTAASYANQADPLIQNVVVLACSNVSLNNSSFPRGLIFHSDPTRPEHLERLSFFPAKDRMCPLSKFRAYRSSDLQRLSQEILSKQADEQLSAKVSEQIQTLLNEVYSQPEILELSSFSEQASRTNFHLWQKFFPGQTLPNLVSLDQEALVAKLISKHHLTGKSFLNRMIFDPELVPLILKHYEGITGAFSQSTHYGTYLFWALPAGQKYRLQLWRKGDQLVSTDGTYKINLNAKDLQTALEQQELIPSMLLCYTTLAFYYGLKCLGGFSQVNYLTFMKDAYLKVLSELGAEQEIAECEQAQTKELCGEFTIAFLQSSSKKELSPATGLDLILYGNRQTWPQIVELSKSLELQEALNPLMTEFYKIIYPEKDRDPTLSAITAEEITVLTGLDKKIKACAVF